MTRFAIGGLLSLIATFACCHPSDRSRRLQGLQGIGTWKRAGGWASEKRHGRQPEGRSARGTCPNRAHGGDRIKAGGRSQGEVHERGASWRQARGGVRAGVGG